MIKSGSTWTVTNGTQRYSGTDMQAGLTAAYNSLPAGRTTKHSILVKGDGDISASAQLGVPSYTILNICGTINVTGTPSGSDRSPLYVRGRTQVDIPNAKMTGSPQYGIFIRESDNTRLGRIELRLTRSAGIGIRVDSGGNASTETDFNTNFAADYVYGQGMGSHILETYGISGIDIGTVEGNDVAQSGVLLNRSINAQVDLVNCTNCGSGTGYAAFRMANRNGRFTNGTYPTNIRVGEVRASGGGRGIFCVSESGGAVIDRVTIQNTGNNSVLIENCYNVTIAQQGGSVSGGGEFRLSARTEFPNSSDIFVRNLAFTNVSVRESPCATNSVFTNNTFVNSPTNVCNP